MGQLVFPWKNNFLPKYFNHICLFLIIKCMVIGYNTRNANILRTPFCRTKLRQFSLKVQHSKFPYLQTLQIKLLLSYSRQDKKSFFDLIMGKCLYLDLSCLILFAWNIECSLIINFCIILKNCNTYEEV